MLNVSRFGRPELLLQAPGRQPTGVMIARGDLAVEIEYRRLSEMQEEILWLREAAFIRRL